MRARLTYLYVCLTTAAAISLVAIAAVAPQQEPREWTVWGIALLLAACIASETRSVKMPGGTEVSVATIPHLVGAILLPAPLAAVVAGIGILLDGLSKRQSATKVVFNCANTAATVALAALVAQVLGVTGHGLVTSEWDGALRFFVVALIYYVVNNLVLAGVLTVSTGEHLWRTLLSNARSSAPPEVAVAIIGGLVAFMWVSHPFWLPAVAVPAIIAQATLEYVAASGLRAQQLEHQALHDLLTDLPNRGLLQRRLAQAIVDAGRENGHLALLMMDLDRFKDVNDTFGHHYGDLLLQEAGRRLTSALPDASTTIARVGGDEFAVLLPEATLEEADAMARQLLVVLGEPFALEQYDVSVGASVGIAAYPDHGADPGTLLRRADVAMYVAKRSGLGHAVYAMEQDEHSRDRLELAADLKRAIEHGELRLHYQPIVSLKTGRLEEVEALLRWQHPKRGLVPPGHFIPIAEETGMIVQIGRWVLEEACRQAVIWRERYPAERSVVMSVNISAKQVQQTDLPAEVKEVLRATGMDPRLLKLEITESVAMENAEVNIATLWLLKGMGIRLAIDDFGTGYSSLGYLKRFPVETLKIDKVFVDGLGVHPEDSALIAAIIAFAHAVGLSTTAEGVEEAGQLAHLRELGADRVQGYFCSKPVPAEALDELLRTATPLLEGLDSRLKPVGQLRNDGARLPIALPPRAA